MLRHIQLFAGVGLALALLGCSSVNETVKQSEPVQNPVTTSAIQLDQEMRNMGSAYGMFNEAQNQQDALKALSLLSQAVERSGHVYPAKIAGLEQEKTAYLADLARMQQIIQASKKLVEADNLVEAKLQAKEMNAIKESAHKRYR